MSPKSVYSQTLTIEACRCQKPEGCPADAGGRGAGSFLDTGLQFEHKWVFREPPVTGI